MKITLDTVRCAVALRPPEFDPVAAQRHMTPDRRPLTRTRETGNPRLAATLLLLFPVEDELHFILTRRPDTLNDHAGQISLPGGRMEEGETYIDTALREACEEVGVCDTDDIEILGRLHELYIPPSDFLVHPIVAYMPHYPDEWAFSLDEVSEIIECPVHVLMDDAIKKRGIHEVYGLEIFWYAIGGHQVWGATAIMLSEFEMRLRHCIK
jgi:8-oxo-dGTP pyrophosphatase MutT (NUDIX family)